MAPSGGYHVVPDAVRAIKYAISRTSNFVRARLAPGAEPSLQAVPAVSRVVFHALHPIALLRQSRTRLASRQNRLFSTAFTQVGQLSKRSVRSATAKLPTSATRAAIGRSALVPFSAPLRPNLTGGALPRTAGGYSLGGGGVGAARHFSHTGSAQAHVVQNVHAAVRAFFLQGGKPLYDGKDPRSGALRFRNAGVPETAARSTLKAFHGLSAWEARGTSVDFHINPAITAVTPASDSVTLEDSGVLTGLAGDFARQLRDLAAVYADLKRLSQLGALPLSRPDAATLRVRFPGCDAVAVTALCDELGVTRGIVHEDPGWLGEGCVGPGTTNASHCPDRDVEMALLFPWAPSDSDESCDAAECFKPEAGPYGTGLEWHSMLSPSPDPVSSHSNSFSLFTEDVTDSFASINFSDAASEHDAPLARICSAQTVRPVQVQSSGGIEGIYRFLQELEGARHVR